MSEYGVTPKGIRIKRLDTIIDELHDDLSEGWEVNTRLNPNSLLNVQLVSLADKLAELWEFGEQIYNSMYPFSAESSSLDNAAQFGGAFREDARPTFYPIHARCVDGTRIPRGSLIRTSTSPAIDFQAAADYRVMRNSFNSIEVRVAAVQQGTIYTIALNGTLHSYTSVVGDDESGIIAGLALAIDNDAIRIAVTDTILEIISIEPHRSHELVLSSNLTTESVTGIISYASVNMGEVTLPNGTITQIVTSVPGLISVNNRIPYIAGRLTETDVEFRQSYANKIFARSSRMIESVRSAILLNVQGIIAVAGYQNDTNFVDAFGRWPHSIEMVVDGGSDLEIALQIWSKKTDGIQTFGSTEITVPGDEGEPMIIRFNRPRYIFVWFRIRIYLNTSESLPPNYVEAIQAVVAEAMAGIEPGVAIVPQRLIEGKIYANIPGISYIETTTFHSEDPNEQPAGYERGVVKITPRQRAVTELARIEVLLDG